MVKPEKTLTFFVFILIFLGLLTVVFPKNGITISNDVTLHFPDLKEFMTESISKADSIDSTKAIFVADNDLALIEQDTAQYIEHTEVIDSAVFEFKPKAIMTDSLRQPLNLPASGLKCLENLFSALIDPDELKHVVRIMHYGDSQIETDRITNYLRYKLQQQFGGSGPGLIPAKTAYDYKSPCAVTNSENWKRYTVFPAIDKAVKHTNYGILAAFCCFGPLREKKEETAETDSLKIDSTSVIDSLSVVKKTAEDTKPKQILTGSISFKPSSLRPNLKTIKKCRLLYGNTNEPCDVKVKDGETVLYDEKLKPSEFYSTKLFNFAEVPNDLKFEFSSPQSPEIYGFALDGNSGVAVDNIALRGCSGTIFTKINGRMLAQMYNELNVKCVILQFGGNAVPYLTAERLNGFVSMFASQIRYIKRLCPKMSIIVVGPADMSTKVEDRYETYEILPPLVEALKSTALSNDCAFWDMYEAMGGENTMPDWVYHVPQLAEKDFVHFTPNGANIMARMLYTAIISRYNEWLRKK
jgi:lysophospholipase L1-like esterase